MSAASHAEWGDAAWRLLYEGWRPEQQGLRETLCTLGNGYFATRGACPTVGAGEVHYPGTYLAGGYDRAVSELHGRSVENEDLVNFPNWLPLTFRPVGGEWFELGRGRVLAYCQCLELKTGMLRRTLRVEDAEGRRTRWSERRLVSMAEAHVSALEVTLLPENWEGAVEIRSALDGTVVNVGVARYRELEGRHLEILEAARAGEESLFLRSRTRASRLECAQVGRTRLTDGAGAPVPASRRLASGEGWVAEVLETTVARERPVRVEKVHALYTGRDVAIAEPGLEARDRVAETGTFDVLLEAHGRSWARLWEEADFVLAPAHGKEAVFDDAQLKLRAHSFHLLQTLSPHSAGLDVGVPARGWHGEAYRGHVFWDEIFVLPLLTMRLPFLTRSALMYRYHRLPRARRAAREAGYAGAMFPWQSGSDGREETQSLHLNPTSGRWLPDESRRQRHINAAIVYNLWHYYQLTDDLGFLDRYGAEMMLEIARFWASLATWDAQGGRYEIRGVMGPDEYHTAYPETDPRGGGGLSNNAYTNVMVAWVMARVRDLLSVLPDARVTQLRRQLDLSDEELERWWAIGNGLKVCFLDDGDGEGVISQFEGYDRLEEFDWAAYRERYGNIQRLDRILEAEGDTPNRYKVSKQADVLMLFFLFSTEELVGLFEDLGYRFEPAWIPRNIGYYLKRTSHGSTLSWLTHAWVVARCDRTASWQLFRDALDSDLDDIQGGTTQEGVHLGAMAGTVDLVHRCYAGVEFRGNALCFNPCLPAPLASVRLRLHYRRHLVDVWVTQGRLRVTSAPSLARPVTVAYRHHVRELAPGSTLEFRLFERAPPRHVQLPMPRTDGMEGHA